MNFFHGDLTGKKWGIDGDLVKKSMFHGDLVITGYVIREKNGDSDTKIFVHIFYGDFLGEKWEFDGEFISHGNFTGKKRGFHGTCVSFKVLMGIKRGKDGDLTGHD